MELLMVTCYTTEELFCCKDNNYLEDEEGVYALIDSYDEELSDDY